MDERRARAVLAALRTLRSAVEAEPELEFETAPFNGWVKKLGEAIDEDLAHLLTDVAELHPTYLLPSIDMVIAFADQMLDHPATRPADKEDIGQSK